MIAGGHPVSGVLDPFEGADLEHLRTRRGCKWSTYGDDVVPAWVADLDAAPCPAIVDALNGVIARGDLVYPADDIEGEVASVFSDRMRDRFAWSPDPDHVSVCADVVQAVSRMLWCCTERGDGVMIPMPSYPNFHPAIEELGRRVVPVPTIPTDRGRSVDLDALEASAAIDGNRVLVLINPHNPTGTVFDADELAGIAEVCARHRIIVVADEIWAEFVLDETARHVPFAPVGEARGVEVFTVTSASKSHNIAGLRLAVGHSASDRLRSRLAALPRPMRGEVSVMAAEATMTAWRGEADDWLAALVAAVAQRQEQLATSFAEYFPELSWKPPRSTYISWVDFSPLALPTEPFDFFLERAAVALGEGVTYDPACRGWARVNVGTSEAVLSEVIERMVTAVDIWRG